MEIKRGARPEKRRRAEAPAVQPPAPRLFISSFEPQKLQKPCLLFHTKRHERECLGTKAGNKLLKYGAKYSPQQKNQKVFKLNSSSRFETGL